MKRFRKILFLSVLLGINIALPLSAYFYRWEKWQDKDGFEVSLFFDIHSNHADAKSQMDNLITKAEKIDTRILVEGFNCKSKWKNHSTLRVAYQWFKNGKLSFTMSRFSLKYLQVQCEEKDIDFVNIESRTKAVLGVCSKAERDQKLGIDCSSIRSSLINSSRDTLEQLYKNYKIINSKQMDLGLEQDYRYIKNTLNYKGSSLGNIVRIIDELMNIKIANQILQAKKDGKKSVFICAGGDHCRKINEFLNNWKFKRKHKIGCSSKLPSQRSIYTEEDLMEKSPAIKFSDISQVESSEVLPIPRVKTSGGIHASFNKCKTIAVVATSVVIGYGTYQLAQAFM